MNFHPAGDSRKLRDLFRKHGSVNSVQFSVTSVTQFNCGI